MSQPEVLSPPRTPLLELRLLGEPVILMNGVRLPLLRTRKGVSLLALLALRSGKSSARVERETVAGLLWADSEQTQSFGSLRRALTDLRSALADAAILLQSPTPRSLRVDVAHPGFVSDFSLFDALPKNIAEASDAALNVCADAYRGVLLQGFDDEWILGERARYESLYASVLSALADRAELQGDDQLAQTWLRRLIALDSLHEEPHRRLLSILARIGDFGAAILLYRALRERLRNETGTEPSAQTAALFQRIRSSARTGGKDFALGQPSKTVTGRTAVDATLPTPLTPMIGRDAEIQTLVEQVLAPENPRLMTLTGTGGVGKTRLALAIARESLCAQYFTGGIYWVDLAPVRTNEELHRALLSALQIAPPPATTPTLQIVSDFLLTRSEPVLLLWDNAEQIASLAASLADALLRTVPLLRILATSRQPLYAQAEVLYPVSTLPAKGAEQLFVSRLCAVRPQAAPEPATVRRLCQRLDGLPLAIELAAARASSLTLTEIETRLADRFRLLTSVSVSVIPRQKTLRALVEWSYDLLSEPEQRLFRRLCVFPASFTAEFAHRICGEPDTEEWDTLDILANLAEKSLLVRAETGHFRLLETLREYGTAKCSELEVDNAITVRHASVFAEWAKMVRPQLYSEDQTIALQALDGESDNLRFAVETAIRSEDTRAAYTLCRALIRWWVLRGRQTEGRSAISRTLSMPYPSDADAELNGWHGDLLTGAGNMARHQGDYAMSKCWHENALTHFRTLGEPNGVANALGNLATVAHHTGDLESARHLREEGLAIQRKTGDQRGIAMFLQNLGNLHSHCGRHEEALNCLTESLDIRRRTGDKDDIAHSLFNMAAALYETGDRESARTYLEESLRLLREIGDKGGMVSVLNNLSTVAQDSGDLPTSRGYLREGFTLLETMNAPQDTSDMLRSASYVVESQGDNEGAVRLFAASMRLNQVSGVKPLPVRGVEEQERVRRLQSLVSPATYKVAWLIGERWTVAQAIQEATNLIGGD
ncbi:MAG: tetratricopeptide repeat protein [Fibrella sp.]|nr:tetratricopeptide repeat protein [Armatimonadota bacterium]